MFKKISASILVASLIALPAQASFNDVGEDHANYDAILFMQDTGVVEGYPDGGYHPDQTINRAEFTKIIMEAVYPGQAVVDSCFDDVQQKDWFADYVCNAKVKGIVGGYPDGTFKPESDINFAEASQIINIAYGYVAPIEMAPEEAEENTQEEDTESEESLGMANPASVYCEEQGGTLEIVTNEDGSQTGECTLEDGEVCEEWAYYNGECPVSEDLAEETEDWFKPYVDTLAAEYAIPTTITSFDHKLTRGEMAEMIYRLQEPNKSKASFNYTEIKEGTLASQTWDGIDEESETEEELEESEEVEIDMDELKSNLTGFISGLSCLTAETNGEMTFDQIDELGNEHGFSGEQAVTDGLVLLNDSELETLVNDALVYIDENCLEDFEDAEVDPEGFIIDFLASFLEEAEEEVIRVSINEEELLEAPVLGDPDAPITIVEYSDFECPFCKSYATETFPQIKEQYIDTGKVKYVFKDFPLSFHPNALEAAQAAECARAQGGDEAYFEFHDALFTLSYLFSEVYESIAIDLDLDEEALVQCIEDETYLADIQAELAEGTALGVSGTPAFFINGVLMVGAHPFEDFQTNIDRELAILAAEPISE